jgi:DNA-binding GntR family transcriptional regulator
MRVCPIEPPDTGNLAVVPSVDTRTIKSGNSSSSYMKNALRRREPMPAARTRAESIRLKLEEEILSGVFQPGQKLDEETIAKRFEFSRTPVREALKTLVATGLVEIRPHQGAYVASVTTKGLIEMFEVMMLLEISCAELAARRHTLEDRKNIQKAQKECESPNSLRNPMAFYDANARFHEAIYRAAHNTFLASQAQALRLRLEPYRRHILYHAGLVERGVRDHCLIMQAIFAMDSGRARTAMREHMTGLRDNVAVMIDALDKKIEERNAKASQRGSASRAP